MGPKADLIGARGPLGPSWVLLVVSWAPPGRKKAQEAAQGFPKRAPGLFGEPFGDLLGAFLGSFLDHVSDLVFGSLLARMLVHFGTVWGPSGTQKTATNAER